ncbi:MAG: 4Fe-4S dicluster domain-containing protein [Desulforhopalus sp.]
MFSEPSSQAVLLPERCLRKRLNTNQCTRCLDVCPSHALALNGREIVLDETQCSGCMACVTTCPQDALACDIDLDELLYTIKTGRDVIVSCVRQTQTQPDEVVVPCVGVFSKQSLTAIAVSDCRSVTFDMQGCSKCVNREVATAFMADYKLVIENLLDIASSHLVISPISEQSHNAVVDRRSYLTSFKKFIVGGTKKRLTSEPASSHHPTNNERRVPYKTKLVQNLIVDQTEDARKKILSILGNSLSVNDNCTCCPLCKGICPTGAIKIERSEQGKKIKFEMLDCSGCGLCVEFCKKGALSLRL